MSKENKGKSPNKKEKDPIEKMASFAFTMSTIGVCTIGICPAFGIMGIVVPTVLKKKGAKMSGFVERTNKKSILMGIISLIMFVIDVVILLLVDAKTGIFS